MYHSDCEPQGTTTYGHMWKFKLIQVGSMC